MSKFNVLVGMLLAVDVKDYVYMGYYKDGGKENGYIDLKIPKGDDYTHFSLGIKDGKVYVSDVEDTEFNKSQAKELLGLIKEKYEDKQAWIKKTQWEKLGIYNG